MQESSGVKTTNKSIISEGNYVQVFGHNGKTCKFEFKFKNDMNICVQFSATKIDDLASWPTPQDARKERCQV